MSDAYQGRSSVAQSAGRSRLIDVVLGVVALASTLLVLLRLIPRLQANGQLAQLASFIPFGIVGWIVVIAGGIWRARRVRWWWPVTAAAVVMLALQVSFLAPKYQAQAAPPCAGTMRIMSQNLELGAGGGPELVSQAKDADVVMLVEATQGAVDNLDSAGMRRRFPYRAGTPDWGAHGSVLYSRWPLTDHHVQLATVFQTAWAQVQVPGAGPVNVAALHPVNPLGGAGPWMTDAHEIGAEAQSLPRDVPLVVAGDFNATPDHRSLRYIQKLGGLELGEDQAGSGFTPTWPVHTSVPTILPIDHVLVRGGAHVTKVTTTELPNSDHRGLHASVCLSRR